ncbi:MAG: glycosyl transferase [Clostridia bacterium]|nr:glycosyl transferase [Clostridia bacterium]
MNLFYTFAALSALLILSLLIAAILLLSAQKRRILKVRDASLTCEELEEHARKISVEHSVSNRKRLLNWPVPRMNESYSLIMSVYKSLNEDIHAKLAIPPAAEWLLDNFYIIEEQVKSIRRDIAKEELIRLPVLKCGTFRGFPRAYAIAMELVAHTDGQIDENILINYLKAYQSHSILTDREIWIMPAMIRLALIENIRNVCESIRDTRSQWRTADHMADEWLSMGEADMDRMLKSAYLKLKALQEINPSFAEHLVYRLRRAGRGYNRVLRLIDECLDRYGTNLDEIAKKEHNSQAVSSVTIGNSVISLKFISSMDWVEVFEETSRVEQLLREDPDGTYQGMDLPSRNYYRTKIEELATSYNVSELHIAKEAVGLAREAANRMRKEGQKPEGCRLSHVGYYLVGKGAVQLESKLGSRRKWPPRFFMPGEPGMCILYLGSVAVIAAAIVSLAVYYAFWLSAGSIYMALLAAVAVILPSSEIAICLINWIVSNIKKPAVFPRLELKDGIPEEYGAMVVIPALLPDEKRVGELLENLEIHYLANREENICFALLGDFKDSLSKTMPEDEKIIKAATEGIQKLNEKYSCKDRDIFYYFHRRRVFSSKENKWMGWERKRGALLEFNDLLMGSKKTSFDYLCRTVPKTPRFVITLDADTKLPMGMAKKMIGTMAHPLNNPCVDRSKGIVTEGYGLIQPRISFDVESQNKSLFSRIYAGQEGMDPYACAVSDVYQDLFDEGIFTGKGIYDLRVFQEVLRDAIPENTVLSHDLLEGSYVRAGLATDLELVDSYPSRYNTYAARLHRWVRGDWQLVKWLGRTVKNRRGERIKNPLSLISRWKIFDNLRRSLIPPSIIFLITLGLAVLPGSSLIWFGLAFLTLAFPLITAAINYLMSKRFGGSRLKRHIHVISGLKAVLLQTFLNLVFLPHQAYLMLNAAVITLGRVFITHRNMLEWVTAADVEKGSKNSLGSYWKKMKPAPVQSLVIGALIFFIRPESFASSLMLLLIWAFSPVIAYRISIIDDRTAFRFSEADKADLRRIARKTWRYFEEFMNFKNHYLAPDNYQEDPPRGVAHRTSPTNIGLGMLAALAARDLGYIGTYEMAGIISDTADTIEKMEKWNGHLYNWYDTRTLRTLRPRYISTVDSGNFVCYLVTLIQGLGEYLERPLIDRSLADGVADTASFLGKDADEVYGDTNILYRPFESPGVDPVLWNRALGELDDRSMQSGVKKSSWKIKTDRMIKMLRKELAEFMSWIPLMEEVPQAFHQGRFTDIAALLKSNPPLSKLGQVYDEACEAIDKSMAALNKAKGQNFTCEKKWLLELKDKINQSSHRVKEFVCLYNELISRLKSISEGIKFKPLYVEKKHLFSIGFNIEENRLTNSFYDLLASEARQTSYIAIARGEVPPKHWFKMGRALTVVDYYKGLVSWTGTMFEYLMPLLIMKSFRNTLLDETYSFVIRSQKKYGKVRKIPWGASESGFYSMDVNLDYQYKAIGVPWLGLKRGLIEDAVAAPYATFLALMVDPEAAMENIRLLRSEGLEGPYGFYEAADYTRERLPFGMSRAIVKSFMAHHQGMTFLALNNALNDNIMQRRFHADPVVKAAELLLQEKVPTNLLFTKETKEKVMPFKDVVYKEKGPSRRFRAVDPVIPRAHILSNGSYSILITDRGTGYSRSKTAAVTRWREDSTLDHYGMFFYLKNMETGDVWSSAYAPLFKTPEKYEVCFTADKARFRRKDGDIETETEITVASGFNAEIRRLTLRNRAQTSYTIEITSYFEVVMAPQAADVSHPAFSNLFVKTEFMPDKNCIIANRKPRSETDKSFWLASTVVVEGERTGDLQYETDRMQFIGRGNNVAEPAAITRGKPLTNSTGPVLDPVVCFRLRVRIESGKTARVSFITVAAENYDAVLEVIEKLSAPEPVEGTFKLAFTRSQVENRYLNIKAGDLELYQDMISHILFISPLKRSYMEHIAKNIKGQSALWAYGISGDIPIVLLTLRKTDETDILYELLKAHEYWRLKDLRVDLVILNDEENSYNQPLHSLLTEIIAFSHARDLLNKSGGVFILNMNNIPQEDIALLHAAARLILKGDKGSLADQVKLEHQHKLPESNVLSRVSRKYTNLPLRDLELHYFNELGGFTKDGREYVIKLDKGLNTPVPWSNVVANPHFGFLVTESGSGYTWCENSRENKLTPWSNDPVSDTPGEVIYLSDCQTGEKWTITPLPIREEEPYIIRHGFGYSCFEHNSHGLGQELIQFVPLKDTVKISILRVRNSSEFKRNLTITYYIRPVMGVSDQSTSMHIRTFIGNGGVLLAENPYNEEFAGRVMFVGSSEKIHSLTGDRKEFFGNGGLSSPEALSRERLSGNAGAGYDPCAAIQIRIDLEAGEEREAVLLLGEALNLKHVNGLVKDYGTTGKAKAALKEAREFWQGKLGIVNASTPDLSMDLLLNGWLIYQVISCRIWARSAFYQSGGAFGFRDQLQDSLAVAVIWPEICRRQLLLHASHQYQEGDVQHWWHEPANKGTRTRFSDDLLWLVFVTVEYLEITGDHGILDEIVPFLTENPLKDFEDERYGIPQVSSDSGTLYEHCIRAIDRSLKFGAHGIPLMGSGDWNDGMSTVGNRGSGESVWLGWFICRILDRFEPIARSRGDEERAARYADIAKATAANIEKNAWDGSWYRRAYFDNGTPLGSMQNSECKIDAIAQAWAVISGAGDPKRAVQAMNSAEDYLVQRDEGLIKLLTPPFDEGDLEPGYIKGYVPGVRENGGQYTHAAAWVIIANALLGEGDKAWEFFELINPINHSRTHIEYSRYKVEPYVMAADVYAAHPHVGRGGWTWYTGSAGWMYKAGIEYILGFKKVGETIVMNPCIPKKWTEYEIQYRYKDTVYEIRVRNPEGVNRGVRKIVIDGAELDGNVIALANDRGRHKVEVVMGPVPR